MDGDQVGVDRSQRDRREIALRILRDEALAQDAVQETFLSVWRTADRFLAERASARTCGLVYSPTGNSACASCACPITLNTYD